MRNTRTCKLPLIIGSLNAVCYTLHRAIHLSCRILLSVYSERKERQGKVRADWKHWMSDLGPLGGQESFEGSFKTDLWPGRAKGADFRFE